jgi:O-antigen ligase
VAVVTVLLSHKKKRFFTVIVLLGLIGIGVYIVQSYLTSTAFQKYVELYSMIFAGKEGPSSYTSRLDIWSVLWQLVKESPSKLLFGVSFDEGQQWQTALDITTDSDYMFMLFYGGIAGLGSLLALYWCIHSSIKRALDELPGGNQEREALLLAARGIFFGMVVIGFVGGFMTGSGTAWRASFMVYTLIGASLGVLLKTRHNA